MVVNSNDRVGEGRVSPASASDSEPSTSILMKTAAPCLSFPAWRTVGRLAERVRGGGDRWVVDVEAELEHSRAAADRDRHDGYRTIAAVKEFQRLDQRRLRLDRHHARAQVAQDGDAVAHMRANIEDKIARRHEPAVKTLHRRTARAVAIINPQRTCDAADGPPTVVPTVVPGLVPGRVHDRFMTTPAATARSQAA